MSHDIIHEKWRFSVIRLHQGVSLHFLSKVVNMRTVCPGFQPNFLTDGSRKATCPLVSRIFFRHRNNGILVDELRVQADIV